MTQTTKTPFQTQFITKLTSVTPKTTININNYIPEACDARHFVYGYTTRLAAFASTDADLISGKKLLAIRINWSDGTAMFPVCNDRGSADSTDIFMTLTLQNASASQLFHVSIDSQGDSLADGAELSLFWCMVGEAF